MAKSTFHFRADNSTQLVAFALLLLLTTMAGVGDSSPIPATTTRSATTERRTACEQLDENVRIVHRLFLTTEKFFKHFNELRFGNPEYSNRDLTLRGLPELSTSYTDWESLTSEVRLMTMRHNLHQLYPFLDVLEVDEGEAVVREAGRLEEKLSRQLQNVLSHTRSLMRAISTTNTTWSFVACQLCENETDSESESENTTWSFVACQLCENETESESESENTTWSFVACQLCENETDSESESEMHLMNIENDETDNATPAPVHLSETPSEYDRSLRDHIIIRDFVDFLRRVQRDFMKLRYNNGCRRTTRSPTHTGRRS
ncbi:PREDICTED: uncharacterized protein LOC109473048 isoform X1 [Branchiostoma belcheri]|uniref:Uncharacterized protein LOC109473048 isoform X1 n=1 Tax=Branchiostoma belcheri TaxID=7741 RepID=A0A6P4ZBP2_BRABE|nr:PREDICTED: uncharacterized protein LOC109473048 isoform X1 [Branchiostoma belcheri]